MNEPLDSDPLLIDDVPSSTLLVRGQGRRRRMTAVLAGLTDLGLPTVVTVALIYILLRGEFAFRYPARRR
jgi:hypothetical protein